jgi:exopolysaccharide biosynthesis polyprenyl glycosylphosphotransferase
LEDPVAVSELEGRRRLLPWALRRERALWIPVPFAGLIALVDAAALVAAAALTTGADPITGAYLLTIFVSLNAGWTRACRIAPRFSDDAAWLLVRMAGPAVTAAALGSTGRWDAGTLVPISVGLVMAGRFVSYGLNQVARSRALIEERTVIVGAGGIGSEVAFILRDHGEYGLLPVGFIDSSELRELSDLPLPLLGDVRDLEEVIRSYDIRRVIIAFGGTTEPDLVRAIRASERLPVFVHYVPRFFELGGATHGISADDLRGIPLVPLPRRHRGTERIVKRTFDLIGAALGLVLTTPILGAAALAVRMTSPGPVIFRQERIGRDGKPFVIFKFRTMRVNGDSDTAWFGNAAEHVTGVGRFLRKTSIDELPQLVNVLRGEMSLVGPRPERPYFVEQFRRSVPGYDDRHRVGGGITGWAQIHGRGRDLSTIPERARLDNSYIEHWSAWRDLVILVRTFKSVLAGDR